MSNIFFYLLGVNGLKPVPSSFSIIADSEDEMLPYQRSVFVSNDYLDLVSLEFINVSES